MVSLEALDLPVYLVRRYIIMDKSHTATEFTFNMFKMGSAVHVRSVSLNSNSSQ